MGVTLGSQIDILAVKSPNRGGFEIEGGSNGGAATRAVSMVVAGSCGLG